MIRSTRLSAAGALLVLLALGPAPAAADTDAELETRAAAIHDRVLTLDSHVDIPFSFATDENDPGWEGIDPIDLVKMEHGKLDAAVFSVFVPQNTLTEAGFATAGEQARTKFRAIRRMALELYPNEIGLALNAADVKQLVDNGQKAAIISIVNGYSLGEDAQYLDEFYALGARSLCFTHRGHNQLSDSARPNPSLGNDETLYGGLSELGRDLVPRLNEMGMIIDVSQISHDALMEVTALTQAPVIASHSSVHALKDNPRNLTDEAMLSIKQTGGVVQIVAFDGYLKDTSPERSQAILAVLQENPRVTEEERAAYRLRTLEINEEFPGASVKELIDHVDYVVDLLGIDHVGLATDFNHGGGISGWMDAGDAPNVTLELVKRGYSEDDIAKIWGGNYLRVFAEVERIAAEIQTDATTGSSE